MEAIGELITEFIIDLIGGIIEGILLELTDRWYGKSESIDKDLVSQGKF